MAGLDGYNKTNGYLHMKNMLVNAKRVLGEFGEAFEYNNPTTGISDFKADPKTQRQTQTSIKVNKEVKVSTGWKKDFIEKHKNCCVCM